MALLLHNGSVFLHIPKTGGTWVTRALERLGLVRAEFGHMHADMDRVLQAHLLPVGKSSHGEQNARLDSEIRKDTFKFCFVRNPIQWFESWWSYMDGLNWPSWGDINDKNRWHPVRCFNHLKGLSFNDFVGGAETLRPGFVTEMYSRYTSEGIGFIGKQETLVDSLVQVLGIMNCTFDEELLRSLPRVNESRAQKQPVLWNPSLLNRVTQLETAGLLRYGYATHSSLKETS